jgi:tRNA G18 (ribose-2'-O)-methylase SpoU
MGAILRVPAVETNSLAGTLRALSQSGICCFAAHCSAEQRLPSQVDFRGDCCLVLGSEGYGLSPEVLAACDEAVAIPMAHEVSSLNVGSAAAALLYEVNRQRGLL